MRLHPYEILGVRQPALDELRLTEAERRTLRRAAEILLRVRELRNGRAPVDWYMGDEDDLDLTFGARICEDLAESGAIDAPVVP
jgi:hypothetical protein